MNRRKTLLGYKYENGQIVIDDVSADIVKEIFQWYVNGKTLLEVSELLNKLHIEYMSGVSSWNKARIKRILENDKYTGDGVYPQIITEEVMGLANEIKARRNTQKQTNRSNDIYCLSTVVICPCCGSIMKRYSDSRLETHERWRCRSHECKKVIGIPDEELLENISDLLNAVIRNSDAVEIPKPAEYVSMDTYRAENELNRMLDSRQMAVDDIKTKLIEYASLQYNDIHNEKYEAQRLKDLFLNQKATDGFSADLFNRTVTAVSFDSDNNVTITLLNGQTIGKELTDGTAEEKSYGYQSDNHRQRGYQEQISAETSCGVLPGIHSAGRTNQQL